MLLCIMDVAWRLQQELLDLYTLNLHRIDKDVQRCDRNYWYFTPDNLEKLRNIMCRWGAKIYTLGISIFCGIYLNNRVLIIMP